MKITNMEQRTKEWFEHRKKYINATEVAAILKLDQYKTQEKLIHDKLFGSTFSTNKYVEHGSRMEPIAKAFFEKLTDLKFPDIIFTDDKTHLFSSSLDGFNEEKKVLLEIKCPYIEHQGKLSLSWQKCINLNTGDISQVPLNYYCQMQCQLYCSQADFGYFFVYVDEDQYYVKKVYPEQYFVEEMVVETQKFLKQLNNYKTELFKTVYLKKLALSYLFS